MLSFDYFRTSPERFIPKTARTAFRAVATGLLPPEAFLHLGTSVKALDEEPLDLEALERVLSREDLDLESNRILLKIFSRLARSPDPELGLFAAESINLVENRYLRKIEALKKKLEGKNGSDQTRGNLATVARKLAALLFELAQLSPSSIRNFYLREAYFYLQLLSRRRWLVRDDVVLVIRVLLELRLYGHAQRVFERLGEKSRASLLLLAAEMEFRRRNFAEAQRLCRQLGSQTEQPGVQIRQILSYWQGE